MPPRVYSTGLVGHGPEPRVLFVSDDDGILTEVTENTPLPVDGGLLNTAFGEVLTAEATPVSQILAVNGLSPKTIEFESESGTATTADSEFVCSTGTTANSFASILTARNLPYRAGEGGTVQLTARFTAGVADSTQIAGLISTTESLAFGFVGTEYGINYRHHGEEEIQDLQITSATTGGGDVTVTVNGTAYTVPVTADTVQVNANEIADSLNAQVANFQFTANNDTITALDLVARPNGAFAFALDTATGTAGTWTQLEAGALAESDFFAQADWNGGLDFTVNPLVGNVYKIQYQYLGYGSIEFLVENPDTGRFQVAHIIKYANANVRTSLGDPNMRGGWAVSSQGSTTDLTLAGASCETAIQGKDIITNDTRALENTVASVGLVLTNLITIRNRTVRGVKRNRADTHVLDISGLTDSTKGAIIEVICNATVAGDVDFQYVDKALSTTEFDVGGTLVTGGTLVDILSLPPTSGNSKNLDGRNIVVVPNGTITLAARVVAVPASSVSGVIGFVEDI
jgi:hypothetical protein